MIANNEIPPYMRLSGSMTMDGMNCLSSYALLVENSDRRCSTASSSSLACQVSVPTAMVTVERRIKIADRFCILRVNYDKLRDENRGLKTRLPLLWSNLQLLRLVGIIEQGMHQSIHVPNRVVLEKFKTKNSESISGRLPTLVNAIRYRMFLA